LNLLQKYNSKKNPTIQSQPGIPRAAMDRGTEV